jgi:hypothetical protein
MRSTTLFIAFALSLLAPSAGASEPGTTPVSAIEWDGVERTGTVRTSHYYSFAASEEGIMTLTLTPLRGGEVDLTVIHYSGSPAFESRREGAATEEIAVKVARGDRFLVRVISPFGRAADYRLKAVLSGIRAGRRIDDYDPPTRTTDGLATDAAVRIPIGVMVPVEASGTRHFAVTAPAGYLLAVRLVPVSADLDLEVFMPDEPSSARASSMRGGLLTEEAYLLPTKTGEVLIRVKPVETRPGAGPQRYVILVQVRQPGIASLKAAPEPLWSRLAIEAFDSGDRGLGIPGGASGEGWDLEKNASRVLRLR